MEVLQLSGPLVFAGVGAPLEIVNLSNLKSDLEIIGSADDTLLRSLLDAVHLSVYRLTGGRFVKLQTAAFDQVYSVRDTRRVFLQQRPIGVITSIDVGSMTADATFTSTQTLTTANYYLDKNRGIIHMLNTVPGFGAGKHRLRVVYTSGMVLIPSDIRNAISNWVSIKLRRQREGRHDLTSQSKGQESATFIADEIPQEVRAVIESYALDGGIIAIH